MERAALYLKQAIHERMRTRPEWAKLTVIFSDSSVPGEGEHKIMDFIRRQQAQPGYDIHQKHCIYGQVWYMPYYSLLFIII